MKPRKYTPSKRVRNHIAKWEASDFAGLNAAFGGDAVGAKAIELMDMLGDKANAFTDNELDGLLSTYYNLSPKGFRKTLMPYIDAYVADLSDATRMRLDQAMRNRWTIAALKYQKGIRRRAAADADLMGLKYLYPIVEQPDAVRVKPVIPEENTRATWSGAEDVSPYVTGRPMLNMRPRILLPTIEEVLEDSAWQPPFPQLKPAYKNGRLPEFKDGIKGWDVDEQQLKINSWGDDWLFRLLPAARSKVVLRWTATGSKPEPESSEQYTARRVKETTWNKPSGRKMLEMAPAAVDFVPGAGDIKQGLEAAAEVLRGNYLNASLLTGGLLVPNMFEKTIKATKTLPALRYSKEEEQEAAEAFLSQLKGKKPIPDNELASAYELEDITKQVIDKAGTLDYYSSLEDAISYPILRPFARNILRKDVTKNILKLRGFPLTSGNIDDLLDNKPFSDLTPMWIRTGERYNPQQFSVDRINNSSVENALPYLADAIPELSSNRVELILLNNRWITPYLIQHGAVLNSGKPFLDRIPSDWDGVSNVVSQMYPPNVKQNIKWGARKLQGSDKYETLMRLYSKFLRDNPRPKMKYETSDGATIEIDPDSKTRAAYFNPETALKDALEDFYRLFPGESWALVTDHSLSPDSYTLLEALTRRHSGQGKIVIPRKPDGSVSMQRLNNMNKYRTIDHVKKAVKNLEKSTGIKLPEPYIERGSVVAPNFYWTKEITE